MRVQLWFKDWLLGELTQNKDVIIYNSNVEGEKLFFENSYSTPFYNLYNSKNKKIKELPSILNEFVEMSNYRIYRRMFNISEHTSIFEKLFNIGTLSLEKTGFYIRSVE